MRSGAAVRLGIVIVVMVALSAGIAYKLVLHQVVRSDAYREYAMRTYFEEEPIEPHRGTILDRNGEALALNSTSYDVWVYADTLDDPSRFASDVAPLVGRGRRTLEGLLARGGRQRLARRASPEVLADLHRGGFLDLEVERDGTRYDVLEVEEVPTRIYPHGTLAAHVVGFAGDGQRGLTGIELFRHEELLGSPGKRVFLRDARDTRIGEQITPPEKEHRDVVLTIDSVLQHMLEREVDGLYRERGVASAFGIMLDPSNGEVLALANRPTPDLTDFGAASQESQRNRATYDGYEPGSTFKAITLAAAIEAGAVAPDTWFDIGRDRIKVAGHWIGEGRHEGPLTTRDVLTVSCNVGMVRIAQRFSPERLLETVRAFGFGDLTGIALEEQRGLVPRVVRPGSAEQATLAYGYGLRATGLQIASAYAAIANGGTWVAPRIIRGTLDAHGAWEPEPPSPRRRVVSESTARTVTALLESVVRDGTGRRAAIPGYRVAGKTGTALLRVAGSYVDDWRNATFVGFAPAEDPRVVTLVFARVKARKDGAHGGGDRAAPVFSRVMRAALAHLRVPRADHRIVLRPGREDAETSGALPAVSARSER